MLASGTESRLTRTTSSLRAGIAELARMGRQRTLRDPTRSEWNLVESVRTLRSRFENIPDAGLLEEATWLRRQVLLQRGEIGNDALRTGFALVSEAIFRERGLRLYPVQILAGILLARGNIAEMQTGEGKTLTASLPAFVLALRGAGVHVATVNEYLARRDFEEVGPILTRLGVSVGLVSDQATPDEKRAAYECDVTYGTGCQFGFDYLRDQFTLRQNHAQKQSRRFRAVLRGEQQPHQTIQRGLPIVLIDEADGVLIDDAATPLILSTGTETPAADAEVHRLARDTAIQLRETRDYCLDLRAEQITLTTDGSEQIQASAASVQADLLVRPWTSYVELALRAELLMHRDVHYVVAEDAIRLVDQSTGRIHAERMWGGGLQQAVQAKEGLEILAENQTAARVTRQRFYQLYAGVCGMTGTAAGGARELSSLYALRTVRVPTNRPCQRRILPARVFATADARWHAIAGEIEELRAANRPVLVGTRTIAGSELLSGLLTARGIAHRVLNGTQDADEATIIATAGQAGAVTIATNMAGRGTDIRLDDQAAAAGGLHVIVSESHESARIDRQLVGRAARQGDPGTARFYASAHDDLIRQYAPDLAGRMIRAADASGVIHRDCSGDIRRLQQRVERYLFQRRREMYEQDRVSNEILRLGRQSL